jgi:hypothetical protein
LKEYYNLNRDDLRILHEDATLIQKLVGWFIIINRI